MTKILKKYPINEYSIDSNMHHNLIWTAQIYDKKRNILELKSVTRPTTPFWTNFITFNNPLFGSWRRCVWKNFKSMTKSWSLKVGISETSECFNVAHLGLVGLGHRGVGTCFAIFGCASQIATRTDARLWRTFLVLTWNCAVSELRTAQFTSRALYSKVLPRFYRKIKMLFYF